MADNDATGEQVAGCLTAMWTLIVTIPIWLILLFQILNALGDAIPTWVWVLYWVYVPSCVLGGLMNGFARALLKGK